MLESGLEMDSLDVIQAVMLIEDEFDITIEDSGYPISVIDLE